MQPSKKNQIKFEIIIGETVENNNFDVIFENGIPKLAEIQKEDNIKAWDRKPLMLSINSPATLGQDCLKLIFCINENSNLLLECRDYSDNKIKEFNLGSIF